MIADFLITPQESQLQNVQFIKDYGKEKIERQNNKPSE